MAKINVSENRTELVASLSALLFVSPRPVSADSLASALDIESEELPELVLELKQLIQDQTHGYSLHEIAGGFQYRTAPEQAQTLTRLISPKSKRLSRAAAETLAIVAYRQPVQRTEIESIRGVDALPTLKTLLDAKLIRAVGHEDAPGQPTLYGTTGNFLERFGLNDLSELPTIRELERLAADPGETELSDLDSNDAEVEVASGVNVDSIGDASPDLP